MRCPSCDAAVPADAAWCTLCFARLRAEATTPEPAPAIEPPAAVPALELPAPVPALEPLLEPVLPVAAVAVAVAVAEPAASPTWPCAGCEARVPLEEMTCPRCGTAFMGGGGPTVSLHVPGVGDLAKMSPGGRFALMAGGAAMVTVILVLLALVLGYLF